MSRNLARVAPFVAAAAILVAALIAIAATPSTRSDAAQTVTVAGTYRGETAETWARRFRHRSDQFRAARARAHRLRRVLLSPSGVGEAIDLAAATYGVDAAILWRKARCETGGTFSPRSLNSTSSASGLFQFLPSTWRTTPFARFSVWSPYANALAAGWMHKVGRGGEWSCP